MKIVISYNGVKRELGVPFALCMGTEDMGQLIRTMQAAAAGLAENGCSYGWVKIDPTHPCDAPPSTPPRPWAE